MKDSTKRFYALIASFAMAIGALIVYTTMIKPSLDGIQQLRGVRQGQKQAFDDYEAALSTTNSLISRSQSFEALKQAFNQSVPSTGDIPSLMNQLYGMATFNNILVSSFDFQDLPLTTTAAPSLIAPLGRVRATMRCIGKYDDIRNFTKGVETNVRIMDISSVEVSDGDKPDPTLSYTITIDAYYQTTQ